MKVQIIIEYDSVANQTSAGVGTPNGQPLPDLVVVLGMLERAKQILSEKKPESKSGIVAARGLPPELRDHDRHSTRHG